MSESDHSTPSSSSDSASPASALASAQASPRQPSGFGRMLLVVLILLAVVLAAALYEQNRQYRVLRADFQRQHNENSQLIQDARSQADQALSMARKQAAQVEDLRNTLDATSSQVQELDQALQLMTDSGSDLLLLNDIDHLVTIAQQQLSLGGNVANAIISLEAAQAQLARANRPNLAALQQSINGDVDRLRAVATVNLPALSAQLDRLSGLIGSAPLLVPDAAAAAGQPVAETHAAAPTGASSVQDAAASETGWRGVLQDGWRWTQAAADRVAQDLRSLFDVRRVGDSAALLMSPDQAQRFREGLKQRAVTAQLALMMHQSRIWKTELDRVAQAIDQRYDMRAESSRQALKLVRALQDTPIEVALPTLDNSLAAIAAARDAEAAQDDGAPDDSGDAPDQNPSDPAVQTPAAAPVGAGAV
ncbi:uroporphyrinogen-III C-methyltransferase [uncultured Castellaniella sp.]|uniref:uroporphyrinogen-III C-methyltransferase n=1 Tax=uncultured Castellaniella sp. TaxID=647907 RepID=UPI002637C041|nr:uroporphyrinogen-III C-methyltransferase [uncultured Castellaniella sp.]